MILPNQKNDVWCGGSLRLWVWNGGNMYTYNEKIVIAWQRLRLQKL